jgi:hypothetical protein
MALVGDRERERASALLRRHYLEGRLTVEELDRRLDLALRARDRSDLLSALRQLPLGRSGSLLVRDAAQPRLHAVRRAAVVALKAVVWLVASFVLLVLFAAWLLTHGFQLGGLIGFPLAWVAVTLLLWRPASRRP